MSSTSNTPTLKVYCNISIKITIKIDIIVFIANLLILNNSIRKYSKGINIKILPNIFIVILYKEPPFIIAIMDLKGTKL